MSTGSVAAPLDELCFLMRPPLNGGTLAFNYSAMGTFVDIWHPATSDFGLIEAPTASVVAAFMKWQTDIGRTPVESQKILDMNRAPVL